MTNTAGQSRSLLLLENELALNIKSDRSSWKISYSLLKRVENDRMWETAGYRSFSSWIKHMAEDYALTEMALWKIRSAGDSYVRFELSATKKRMYPLPLSQNKLGIETIIRVNYHITEVTGIVSYKDDFYVLQR